ncbi:unnamed protein product [Phaedon cochleariae]|uniref:C-type lectin domain-containing protein n=1 Tax=Phaedon cochleariae TaxID=80249 RepID=A0A9N9SCX5_PHACE|nr:unnamed protein product [Phaedon cochleariae]
MTIPTLSAVLIVLASGLHFSAARAVNISNTWMLPEEGFPVFYRYFRDRISWYEADAVCQFHHGYLVTADSSSQYDAIRAYLKELDITDNVWIGLSKSAEKPNFTWTNLQPLSTEGHWQDAIPVSSSLLCVAMDPAKDFLWKPMSCGGPEVASFICELPIPEWAQGARGCLLTELPSLTVLYIPEQSSIDLTSDCGLDGTKRIACKGDADREEILKQLTCALPHEDFEERTPSPLPPAEPSTTTRAPLWTSNTVNVYYGLPTRHRRETEGETPSTARFTATETFEATNYDTQVTTSNTFDASTSESIEIKATGSTLPEVIQLEDGVATSGNNVTPLLEGTEVTEISHSTFAGSSLPSIEKDIAAEYPSAISQGQLFSIIENGTMFDIIELNETSERDSKTQNEAQTNKQKTEFKPSVKLTQINEKNSKKTSDTKTKPISKKDVYKNADPKKFSLKKNYTKSDQKDEETNVSKEIEIFPIVHDTSIKLNRTFRKELPGESKKKIQTEQNKAKNATAVLEQNPDKSNSSNIDPNLDLLNKNVAENNESEFIESDVESESPKTQLSTESASNVSENEQSEMDETGAAIKPNRQRQLTRPQRRPFYPYFFSRNILLLHIIGKYVALLASGELSRAIFENIDFLPICYIGVR